MSEVTTGLRSKVPVTSEARVQLWLCPSASPLLPSPLHTQAPPVPTWG